MRATAVVVDTNVFSAVLSNNTLATSYSKHITGRRIVVSFQTIAEVRFGALLAGWHDDRIGTMERLIAKTATIPPHDRLAQEWAELRHACRKAGHGLANKIHMADLWIAATARLLNLPLVTHDAVFLGTPSLEVLSELP